MNSDRAKTRKISSVFDIKKGATAWQLICFSAFAKSQILNGNRMNSKNTFAGITWLFRFAFISTIFLITPTHAETNFIGGVFFSGNLTYTNPVVLTNDTIIRASPANITFLSTVDGPYNLNIQTSGTATFNANVGGNSKLASLTVGTNTSGSTVVNNASIITTLGGDTTLSGSPLSLSTLIGNNHVLTLTDSLVTALGGLHNGLAQLIITGGGSVELDAAFSVPSVNVTAPATLTGSGLIIGPVTVQPGATLAPSLSSGPFTLIDSLSLSGSTLMELNPDVPTNDLVRTFGNITYGGSLMVTNQGGTLAAGDSFRLFQGGNYTGTFSNMSLPVLPAGLIWDTRGLTNNGSLLVAALPVITSGAMTGSDDFQLTATGMPQEFYNVLTSTNAALPLANWRVIGSVKADDSGTINFTDATATNACRFYQLAQ